jgi:ubiquinone/menaquinone biosynthesis C-methylase UbiE/DNA-binding transcriptional ArsR family regulator
METLLDPLKAVAEPTRLRILAVLSRTELTVNELCTVLGQSQPRVSRHLKLMCDAGLLVRHSEGTSAFFRPRSSGIGNAVTEALLPLIDHSDPVVIRDFERLAAVRAERAAIAASYFEAVARNWHEMRELHVSDSVVEEALLRATDHMTITDLIDIGTGTGRMLDIFSDRIVRGLGVDLSREMLNLARTHLDEQGLTHCSVRYGNVYDLDVEPGSIDVAILHHVLHFLDDPRGAVVEASRTLRPAGQLLVVDFAPHDVEALRGDFAHRRLGFNDIEVTSWCDAAGLDVVATSNFLPGSSTQPALGVSLWVATKRQRLDIDLTALPEQATIRHGATQHEVQT